MIDNTHSGDSLATIIMEYAMLPSAILTTGILLWWVYTGGIPWPAYIVSIVAGPIVGMFIAALIGLGAATVLILTEMVLLPFRLGYELLFKGGTR